MSLKSLNSKKKVSENLRIFFLKLLSRFLNNDWLIYNNKAYNDEKHF